MGRRESRVSREVGCGQEREREQNEQGSGTWAGERESRVSRGVGCEQERESRVSRGVGRGQERGIGCGGEGVGRVQW